MSIPVIFVVSVENSPKRIILAECKKEKSGKKREREKKKREQPTILAEAIVALVREREQTHAI